MPETCLLCPPDLWNLPSTVLLDGELWNIFSKTVLSKCRLFAKEPIISEMTVKYVGPIHIFLIFDTGIILPTSLRTTPLSNYYWLYPLGSARTNANYKTSVPILRNVLYFSPVPRPQLPRPTCGQDGGQENAGGGSGSRQGLLEQAHCQPVGLRQAADVAGSARRHQICDEPRSE